MRQGLIAALAFVVVGSALGQSPGSAILFGDHSITVVLQKVNSQLAAASPSRGGLEVSKMTPRVVVKNQ